MGGFCYQLLRTPSSDDEKINKSKTRDNMMCGPIVFLPLLAFICTFSEGKSCTGQILPKILTTADNTESVKNCINRGGKCCSLSKDGDFVTWDGGNISRKAVICVGLENPERISMKRWNGFVKRFLCRC